MRNTPSGVFSCGLDLSEQSIRQNGKSYYGTYPAAQLLKISREEMRNGGNIIKYRISQENAHRVLE